MSKIVNHVMYVWSLYILGIQQTIYFKSDHIVKVSSRLGLKSEDSTVLWSRLTTNFPLMAKINAL